MIAVIVCSRAMSCVEVYDSEDNRHNVLTRHIDETDEADYGNMDLIIIAPASYYRFYFEVVSINSPKK